MIMSLFSIFYFLLSPKIVKDNTKFRLNKTIRNEETTEINQGYDYRFEIDQNSLDDKNKTWIFNRTKFYSESKYPFYEYFDKMKLINKLELVKSKYGNSVYQSIHSASLNELNHYLLNYLSKDDLNILKELIENNLVKLRYGEDLLNDFYSNPFSSSSESLDDLDNKDV